MPLKWWDKGALGTILLWRLDQTDVQGRLGYFPSSADPFPFNENLGGVIGLGWGAVE